MDTWDYRQFPPTSPQDGQNTGLMSFPSIGPQGVVEPVPIEQEAAAVEDAPSQRMNPRKALWGGTLMSLGNFLMNPRAPIQNLGAEYYMKAQAYNRNIDLDKERQKQIQTRNDQWQQAFDRQGDQYADGKPGRDLQKLTLDQKSQQEVNPYAQFTPAVQEWKASGAEEQGISFQEFQQRKLAQAQRLQSNRIQKSFVGENGNMMVIDGNGEVRDTGAKGSPGADKIVERGGVPYVETTQPGGQVSYMPLDQYRKDYSEQYKRDDILNADRATQDAAYEADFNTRLPALYQSLDAGTELLAQLEAGEYSSTGMLEGLWTGKTSAEGAALASKAVWQQLQNLQITNLAPVTEKELALLGDLYASIQKDPEANIGAMKEFVDRTQKVVADIERQAEFFYNNDNSMRGYGRSQIEQRTGKKFGSTDDKFGKGNTADDIPPPVKVKWD